MYIFSLKLNVVTAVQITELAKRKRNKDKEYAYQFYIDDEPEQLVDGWNDFQHNIGMKFNS